MGVSIRSLCVVFCVAVFGGGLLITTTQTAEAAKVRVKISKGAQTMRVYVGGRLRHQWRVSTGRRGYRTPSGTYSPKRLHRMWYSRKYDNSPMPYSIFFRGGYAIHGTNYISRLGRRASHGCIRLAPSNAARLFRLVKQYGSRNTRITIR
ncbi:MAG: L,D-transpeptidase [Hyphomicrobiaceae bacterium]